MKKLKERPITMQYMRLLLANSPKDGVNTILKYGSTEVQLSDEQKMLSELLVSPEYNALFEEKWKELVAQ
jgi:ubiquinone biosynthesis protein Coq4